MEEVLRLLADRFSTVVWVPGSHGLWTHPSDPVRIPAAYQHLNLVDLCRILPIRTPENTNTVSR
ncbi:metallophosphoesterase, partial [Streptomyces goshikiensis]